MSKKGLYIFLFTASVAGGVWIFVSDHFHLAENNDFSVCIFKNMTGLACPACGSTRSILAFLHGDFARSVLLNPVGIVLLVIMLLVPVLILYDLIFKNDLLFRLYNKTECFIKKRKIAFSLIALVLINWIWNIYKQL